MYRAMIAINRMNFFATYALSHLTYGIQAWGTGNTVTKLQTLQKSAVRIINNKIYRSHTSIFKYENIFKIAYTHKLHVSLYNYHHNMIITIIHCLNPSNSIYQNLI